MKKVKLIALFTGVAAFIIGYMVLNSLKGTGAVGEEGGDAVARQVVMAAKDIPYSTTITADMVSVGTVGTVFSTDSTVVYYDKLEDVVGKIASADIFTGDQMTSKRVADAGENKFGLSTKVAEGNRAITLPLTGDVALGSGLRVNDYVDVVVTTQLPTATTEASARSTFSALMAGTVPSNSQVFYDRLGLSYSYIAVQNLKVIALGQNIVPNALVQEYTTVTFEATPEEALQLSLIKDSGEVVSRLILRARGDEAELNAGMGAVVDEHRE